MEDLQIAGVKIIHKEEIKISSNTGELLQELTITVSLLVVSLFTFGIDNICELVNNLHKSQIIGLFGLVIMIELIGLTCFIMSKIEDRFDVGTGQFVYTVVVDDIVDICELTKHYHIISENNGVYKVREKRGKTEEK